MTFLISQNFSSPGDNPIERNLIHKILSQHLTVHYFSSSHNKRCNAQIVVRNQDKFCLLQNQILYRIASIFPHFFVLRKKQGIKHCLFQCLRKKFSPKKEKNCLKILVGVLTKDSIGLIVVTHQLIRKIFVSFRTKIFIRLPPYFSIFCASKKIRN